MYHLLGKADKKSLKVAVKPKKPCQYSNLRKTHSTVSNKVPNMKKVLQGYYNNITRAQKGQVTKTKDVTLETTYKVETVTDSDLSSTWKYYQQSTYPDFNLSSPFYSHMKILSDDSEYIPEPSDLAKAIHTGTPRLDLFLLQVDNKITISAEYAYVSTF